MSDRRDTDRHEHRMAEIDAAPKRLAQDVKLSLFSRNMARGAGTVCGYGMGIAIVLAVYKWFGFIPFDWIAK